MKTTIDIPEPLYRKAKIHAVESGQTLKDVVLHALVRELDPGSRTDAPRKFWNRRKTRPAFARLERTGAFRPNPGDADVTDLISEDRE